MWQRRDIAATWESLKQDNISNLVSNIERSIDQKSQLAKGTSKQLPVVMEEKKQAEAKNEEDYLAERGVGRHLRGKASGKATASSLNVTFSAKRDRGTRRRGRGARRGGRISAEINSTLGGQKEDKEKENISQNDKRQVDGEKENGGGLIFPCQGANLQPLVTSMSQTQPRRRKTRTGADAKENDMLLPVCPAEEISALTLPPSACNITVKAVMTDTRQKKNSIKGDGNSCADCDATGIADGGFGANPAATTAPHSPSAWSPTLKEDSDWFFMEGW